MPMVELVLGLVAGDPDLVDVGDDDEVARVHVRRVDCLVAPRKCDAGGEAAEHLVGRVDDVPSARCRGAGRKGFHRRILSFPPERAPAGKFSKVDDCTIPGVRPSIASQRTTLERQRPWHLRTLSDGNLSVSLRLLHRISAREVHHRLKKGAVDSTARRIPP
jgi:hypothetical protein